jgi:hypothetical protein
MITTKDVKRIYPVTLGTGEEAVYIDTAKGHYCLGVPSWHFDYDGLITYPRTNNYRDDWLASCGYDVPRGHHTTQEDYSKELKEKLIEMLAYNEGDIMDHLASEQNDPEFWAMLKNNYLGKA